MSSAARRLAAIAAVLGALAVILGAFGAHALKHKVDAGHLLIFETGVRYQMYHALALLGIALLRDRLPSRLLTVAGWLFVAGVACFSGSLYLLATVGWHWLGPVTPLGGACFIAGWLCAAVAMLRR